MNSGDIFKDNNPHWVQSSAQQVQVVCGTCNKPIDLHTNHQINGMASCWYCFTDHNISRNVLPCPYRVPKSRKFIDRTDQDLSLMERHQKRYGYGQASGSITTVAATKAFINDPNGGL